MNQHPPKYQKRRHEEWFKEWDKGIREAFYVVVAYHQLAQEQSKGHVSKPLVPLFTNDQIIDLQAQRKRTLKLYALAQKGSHSENLIVSADHAWLCLYHLYDKIPTTRRIKPSF